MGTPLTTETASSTPSLKLDNVGDEVKFAVIDVAMNLPQTVFGSNPPVPALNAAGKPKTAHCLTVLVLDAGGATIGDGNGGHIPASANEVANIWIASYSKYDPDRDSITAPFMSWAGATDAVGLEVGHIGSWKYIAELPPTRAGNNGRRDRKFRLRRAEATEAGIVEQCERLHAERKAGGTVLPTDSHDEEPF